MEKETCTFSYCAKPEIVEHETDLLILGGGMSACGTAYEATKWAAAKGLKVTMVDKAATDRSGAVAMGLSAINTYIGLYSRGQAWPGTSLILPGFLELIWWSAPSFTLGGAVREYDVLLVNRIILTIVAFVLLYTLWLLAERKKAKVGS